MQFSPTYPALLPVPSLISDNTLNYAGRYRSRVRLPVLTYLHPVNNCSITRCAQPLVGVRGNRSIQDEKLILAIFSTSVPTSGSSEPPSRPRSPTSLQSSGEIPADRGGGESPPDTEQLEDEMIAHPGGEGSPDGPRIYGAQQRNLIVDARPTVNALAMQAVGLGSENMDHYRFATKIYLGIDNIHVMRNSLEKVIDALKESDLTPLPPNRELLAKSNWLKHITGLLDGASIIARQVAVQHSHVLIHCSDGWDRTSQLSALSQLCLDPYYRTIDGFITLVEKDWLSFGHMFNHRSGFLSSEKWFSIDNERIGGNETNTSPSLGKSNSGAGNALENAFLSAKGLFTKDNASRESIVDSDGETHPYDIANQGPGRNIAKNGTKSSEKEKPVTKPKETAPIFHQFLDATYQLLLQHRSRFEFNERFLRRLLYHLYSCQYGTFLFNSEKERVDHGVREKTRSVWDYFLSRREQFINESYDGTIDDNIRGHERLVLPNGEVKWWFELFGRTDAEMNGPPVSTSRNLNTPVKNWQITASRSPRLSAEKNLSPQPPTVARTPSPMPNSPPAVVPDTVLTGVETADSAIGAGNSGEEEKKHNTPPPTNADPLSVMDDVPERKPNGLQNAGAAASGGLASLANGLKNLDFGGKKKGRNGGDGHDEVHGGEMREIRREMEVEMQ